MPVPFSLFFPCRQPQPPAPRATQRKRMTSTVQSRRRSGPFINAGVSKTVALTFPRCAGYLCESRSQTRLPITAGWLTLIVPAIRDVVPIILQAFELFSVVWGLADVSLCKFDLECFKYPALSQSCSLQHLHLKLVHFSALLVAKSHPASTCLSYSICPGLKVSERMPKHFGRVLLNSMNPKSSTNGY